MGGTLGEIEHMQRCFNRDSISLPYSRMQGFFVYTCEKCQRMGSISKRDELPLQPILEVELFDI